MNKILLTSLFGLTLAFSSANAQVYVRVGPPAAVVERPGPPPGARYVWYGGYHRWDGRRYVWVPGHYIIPPQPYYHRWVPGHWRQSSRGWVWVDGHWSR
jgi:hypothetical protein